MTDALITALGGAALALMALALAQTAVVVFRRRRRDSWLRQVRDDLQDDLRAAHDNDDNEAG